MSTGCGSSDADAEELSTPARMSTTKWCTGTVGRSRPSRGDGHLHLGHHGPAQGLCHHPRQLHVRDGHHGRAWEPVFHSKPGDEAATLLFLPLAHVFGRMVEVTAIRGPG